VTARLRRSDLVGLAGVLWLLGALVLVSPLVSLRAASSGEPGRFCGITLPRAVQVATGPDDCVAVARARAGWGLLLLVLAVPAGAAAVLAGPDRPAD
jgi:hypothetical protein